MEVLRFYIVEKLQSSENEKKLLLEGKCTTRMSTETRDILVQTLKDIKLSAPSHIPWLAYNKQQSLQKVLTMMDIWDGKEFIDKLISGVQWSPALERKILSPSDALSSALSISKWRSNAPIPQFIGKPFPFREIRGEGSSLNLTEATDSPTCLVLTDTEWIRLGGIPTKRFPPECKYASMIPSTTMCASILSNGKISIMDLATKDAEIQVESSLKNPNYINVEILPRGSILLTVGIRNEDTGGIIEQENFGFRFDDKEIPQLEAFEISKEELKEAELVDFNRNSTNHDERDENCVYSIFHNENYHATILDYNDSGMITLPFPCVGVIGFHSNVWVASYGGRLIHLSTGKFKDIGFSIRAILPWRE